MSYPIIINLRKELHQYPELSSAEWATRDRIKAFIDQHHPATRTEHVGETGLMAIYKFPKKEKTVTIRCELDALPIQEVNSFAHRSKKEGVAHKCGHDGHMAIVAGLIFWIEQQTFAAGTIVLLFQPAEETGRGAAQVFNDPVFQALETDYIFALHNIPKAPLHQIIFIEKGFSAEVQSFVLRLTGKESHAAEPENGINPALAISEIVAALAMLNQPNPQFDDFAILTPVHINMGQLAYGVSPANGAIHYTIRTWSGEKMSRLKTKIEQSVSEICHKQRLGYSFEWLEYFPASSNDAQANQYVTRAAKANNFQLTERPYPFKFGEDFGWFTTQYKTAMFGLGAGIEMPALHNADYDFPDKIIETGMRMFQSIITQILES
ncbi:MAG: amidohydrolase [Bacteroidota bacterium]